MSLFISAVDFSKKDKQTKVMDKVFISYRHHQGKWVWDRLVPCLKAAGVEILIDTEEFKAGRTVVGQMDDVQDQADKHLLVLSPDYLESDYCAHEMRRAIGTIFVPCRFHVLNFCWSLMQIIRPKPQIRKLTICRRFRRYSVTATNICSNTSNGCCSPSTNTNTSTAKSAQASSTKICRRCCVNRYKRIAV
jgi:hypothetical protein